MPRTIYDRLGGGPHLRPAVDLLFGKALRDERLRYERATNRAAHRATAWFEAALSDRPALPALVRIARRRFTTDQRRALLELWEEALLELGQPRDLIRASRAALDAAA